MKLLARQRRLQLRAGFAGVVVVFRRESVHDWTPILTFAITTSRSFRRLDPQQIQSALATGFAFYLFALLGTGAILLRFFNIAIFNAFWPFFTCIVVHLLAAMFQFARIILLPPEA